MFLRGIHPRFIGSCAGGCGHSSDNEVDNGANNHSEDASQQSMGGDVKIIFLHHSTGNNVWQGGVPQWFEQYNTDHGTSYKPHRED